MRMKTGGREWDITSFCDSANPPLYGKREEVTSLVRSFLEEKDPLKALSLSDEIGESFRLALFSDSCSSVANEIMEKYPCNYVSCSPSSLTFEAGSLPYTSFGGQECTRVKCEVRASRGEEGTFKIDRLRIWDEEVPCQIPNPYSPKKEQKPHPLCLLFG